MSIAEKLTTIANNEQKVYDAGYNKGYQAYIDLIWDALQDKGARTDYKKAFYNWDKFKECFKPKYDIKPVGSVSEMFADINQYVSIPTLCESQGIEMNFSLATEFRNMLYKSAIWRIGIVDCTSATSLIYAFNNASSLTTIDKLIVHEGITMYTYCFANTTQLQNLTIEGVIAGDGLSVSAHTGLTHDSLMSIINALKDYSGTTTTKTVTLGATNLAKLTDAEKAIATDRGWTLA